MTTSHNIMKASQLSTRLKRLRRVRRRQITKIRATRKKRQSLSANERKEVLLKTNGRCHICGGKISIDEKWHADHVISYAKGGKHSVDNFLPAHALCNSYRRSYVSEELQWILKLGVWFRTLIEEEDIQAIEMAEKFIKHENARQARQKT